MNLQKNSWHRKFHHFIYEQEPNSYFAIYCWDLLLAIFLLPFSIVGSLAKKNFPDFKKIFPNLPEVANYQHGIFIISILMIPIIGGGCMIASLYLLYTIVIGMGFVNIALLIGLAIFATGLVDFIQPDSKLRPLSKKVISKLIQWLSPTISWKD